MSDSLEKLLSNGNARMYVKHAIDILEAYQISGYDCTQYATAITHLKRGMQCIEDRGTELRRILRHGVDLEFREDA